MVVPTPSRVDRMALVSGNEPDMVIGAMGPGNGVATIEKIAVAAVMAGVLRITCPSCWRRSRQ